MRDDLRLAIVKELEAFLMEIPDGMALRITHHHAYHHQLDVDFECGRLFVRSNLRRTLIGMRLIGRLSLRCRCLRRFRLSPRRYGKQQNRLEDAEGQHAPGEKPWLASARVCARPARFLNGRHVSPENDTGKRTLWLTTSSLETGASIAVR